MKGVRWLAVLTLLVRPWVSSMTYPRMEPFFAGVMGFMALVCTVRAWENETDRDRSFLFLCLLFLLSAVSGWIRSSSSLLLAGADLSRTVQIVGALLLGRYAFRDGTVALRRLGTVLFLAAIYTGLDGYDQVTGGLERTESYILLYHPELARHEDLMIRIRDNAAFSTFFYPNAFAGFCVLVLWLSVGRIAVSRNGKELFLPVAGGTGALTGLIASKSEGGWIALTAGGIFFLVGLFRERWNRAWRPWLLGILIFAVLAWAFLSGTTLDDGLWVRLFRSFEVRIGYWCSAARMIRHHPLLGVGFGGFETFYREYAPRWASFTRNPHSLPLQLWVEQGMAGFCAFLGLFGVCSWTGWRAVGRAGEAGRHREGWGVLAGLTALWATLFHGLGEVDLSISGIIVPLAFLLGALRALPPPLERP